ncbi:MAG TPA: PHP domain-containing protein [Candidatus Saccharimonadales bacterium]|nr:PHP domain-containing protein [Candidatus Saccharimonadales bacterium]
MVRVDLHVHTSASFDCAAEPLQVARRCRSLGLVPVFITDHDTIEGGLRIRSEAPDIEVVIGQEITTTRGELIGLFLERPIPPGMEPAEAILEVKAQGGLIYLQHPYDSSRRRMEPDAIREIADQVDIVEVWNGRSNEEQNRLAEDLALTLGLPFGAGSDAHRLDEVGSVYIELPAFDGPKTFLEGLAAGRVVTRPRRLLLRAGALIRRARARA